MITTINKFLFCFIFVMFWFVGAWVMAIFWTFLTLGIVFYKTEDWEDPN